MNESGHEEQSVGEEGRREEEQWGGEEGGRRENQCVTPKNNVLERRGKEERGEDQCTLLFSPSRKGRRTMNCRGGGWRRGGLRTAGASTRRASPMICGSVVVK